MQQTKYMRIVAAGLLMTLFAACAKDDTIVPYDTTEGIPCTVTLNVGAADPSGKQDTGNHAEN